MFRSIKVKLISGLVLLLILMMVAILTLASYNFSKYSYRTFIRSLGAELSHVEYSINLFIDESKMSVDTLAQLPVAKHLDEITSSFVGTTESKRSVVEPDDVIGKELVQDFQAMQKSHPAFVEIYVGSVLGGFVSSEQNSDMTPGYDPRVRPWYRDALPITDRPTLAHAYLSTTTNLPVAAVARTVSRNGKVVGVIGIDISLEKLTTLIKSIHLGESGYMVLIQDDGVILADPRNEDNNFKNVKDLDDPYLAHLFARESGDMQFEKDGVSYLSVVSTSQETGWKLVGIVDEQEIQAPITGMITNLALLGLASLIVIVVLLWLFSNRVIINPLGTVTKALAKISEGDYAIRTRHTRRDEIGDILDTLNDTAEKLDSSMQEVQQRTEEAQEKAAVAEHATREAEEARQRAESAKSEGMLHAAQRLESIVGIVSSASEELSAQIEQSSRGAEVQAQRVTETATSMEEMNASVLEVAQNASEAAQSADNARDKADKGDVIVERLIDSIGQINTQALGMKQSLDQLGQEAEGIGQIMNVITDIADQTNLLALNAAIEAARAGEAGRGFAVVADEVRKLAEKTMHATKEVGNAVEAIQSGTQSNITHMDQTARVVGDANSMASEAGTSLREILSIVEATADQVRSIATASEEQSAASEEINRSVSEVNTISTDTYKAMQEAAKAVLELSEQAQQLQQLIEEMQSEATE